MRGTPRRRGYVCELFFPLSPMRYSPDTAHAWETPGWTEFWHLRSFWLKGGSIAACLAWRDETALYTIKTNTLKFDIFLFYVMLFFPSVQKNTPKLPSERRRVWCKYVFFMAGGWPHMCSTIFSVNINNIDFEKWNNGLVWVLFFNFVVFIFFLLKWNSIQSRIFILKKWLTFQLRS